MKNKYHFPKYCQKEQMLVYCAVKYLAQTVMHRSRHLGPDMEVATPRHLVISHIIPILAPPLPPHPLGLIVSAA